MKDSIQYITHFNCTEDLQDFLDKIKVVDSYEDKLIRINTAIRDLLKFEEIPNDLRDILEIIRVISII